MTHAIETSNLTRRFRGHEAVHELTLAVPPGSICALLGRNGAGKTTTVKMLAGLLRPTGGSSRCAGVIRRNFVPKTGSAWDTSPRIRSSTTS
ncbi:MAG: ATP-binding cassette domain-containing protein [Verrucomicrobiota bacterium]|nr:ATP-binding cassette domain-containing protein [Verrucomicrobiota bacterium]